VASGMAKAHKPLKLSYMTHHSYACASPASLDVRISLVPPDAGARIVRTRNIRMLFCALCCQQRGT